MPDAVKRMGEETTITARVVKGDARVAMVILSIPGAPQPIVLGPEEAQWIGSALIASAGRAMEMQAVYDTLGREEADYIMARLRRLGKAEVV